MEIYENNTEISNTFEQFMDNEQKKIVELCNKNDNNLILRKMTDQFCSYDCTIQSGGTYSNVILITEVKVRGFVHNKYPTAILTQFKIEQMRRDIKDMKLIADKLGFILIPYYLAFYTDAIVGWLIDDPEISVLNCPKTTASDGNNTKINKVVGHFNLNEGEIWNI